MSNDEINRIFSKNLRKLLQEKNATQLQLAEFIGVSNTTINNYVKGYNMPRMNKVDDIAKFFGVSREDLITTKLNESFKSPEEAIEFLFEQKIIAANTGINIDDMSDDDKVQFANRLLDYARWLDDDRKNRNK